MLPPRGGSLVDNTYTTGAVYDNCSVTADFIIDLYELRVTKSGKGTGTITSVPAGIDCGHVCSATYEYGTTVTLQPVPDDSVRFDTWVGECTLTGTDCEVTMDRSKDIEAIFTKFPWSMFMPNFMKSILRK